LICGPGGCRSIIGSIGLLLALDWFGCRNFSTVGGISGGSIPLSLFADGFSTKQIVEMAMNLDFQELLDQDGRLTSVMLEHCWQSRFKGELPTRGKFHMRRFADWLDDKFGQRWPQAFPYWTMATDSSGAQVMFTVDGVFRREQGGQFFRLSRITPDLAAAICASCTIPGFFVPGKIVLDSGETLTLYDGALSWESMRPVTMVQDFYSAKPADIIMFDVGPELNRCDRAFNAVWGVLCGGRCVPPRGFDSSKHDGVVMILPAVTKLRSFDFAAHPDKKWAAVMECFASAVLALNSAYRLTEEQFAEAKDLLADYNSFGNVFHRMDPGELSARTQALLILRGVLDA
jgi:predicted acylesterase/phospholipase RssA